MVTPNATLHADAINRRLRLLAAFEFKGLDALEAARLAELSGALSGFGRGPVTGRDTAHKMAWHEALRSMHIMARLASALTSNRLDHADRIMRGSSAMTVSVSVRPQTYQDMRGNTWPLLGVPRRDGGFDPIAPNVTVTVTCKTLIRAQVGAGYPMVPERCCNPQADAMATLGGAGGFFEDRIAGMMFKVVAEQQGDIEKRLDTLAARAKQAEEDAKKPKKKKKGVLGVVGAVVGGVVAGPFGAVVGNKIGGMVDAKKAAKQQQQQQKVEAGSQESRNIEFEKIKFEMQKLSQMQQAMSNVLNTMDELAKSAIRHIKA
jgi:hypothetical protein